MRASTAIAFFMSAMMAGVTIAQCPTNQCPTNQRRCCAIAPVKSCCPNVPQPTYTVVATQAHCGSNYSLARPCVRYPVVQGYAVVQSVTNTRAQCWSDAPQPTVTYQPTFAQSVTPGTVQNNCNCQSGSVSLQANPQTALSGNNQRNPFSLAGHAREGQAVYHCLQEFLRCCENGGQNCMANYITCSQVTGEPLKYSSCPAQTPTIEEKSPNQTQQNP